MVLFPARKMLLVLFAIAAHQVLFTAEAVTLSMDVEHGINALLPTMVGKQTIVEDLMGGEEAPLEGLKAALQAAAGAAGGAPVEATLPAETVRSSPAALPGMVSHDDRVSSGPADADRDRGAPCSEQAEAASEGAEPSSQQSPTHKTAARPVEDHAARIVWYYYAIPLVVGFTQTVQLKINSKTAEVLDNVLAACVINATGGTVAVCVVGFAVVVRRTFLQRFGGPRRTLLQRVGGEDNSGPRAGDENAPEDVLQETPDPRTTTDEDNIGSGSPRAPSPGPNWCRILYLLPFTKPIASTATCLAIFGVQPLGILEFSLLNTCGKLVMSGIFDHFGCVGDTVSDPVTGVNQFVLKERRCSIRKLVWTGIVVGGMVVASTPFLDEVLWGLWRIFGNTKI